MKKITILLSLAMGISSMTKVDAQAGSYSFAASSGTYTPVTGGIDVDAIEADGVLSTSLPIGFTFAFDGVNYTDVKASSDGYLSFGTSTSNTPSNDLDNTILARRPLIAAFWDDMDDATGSAASYLVTGTAPNQVFTFEWLNWERYNFSSSDPVISFQVKLHESTNIIELIYRSESGTISSSTSASIGIGGVTSFLSLDGTGVSPGASNTSETTTLNIVPADGQVYTFTPPSCPSPSTFTTSNLTSNSVDIDWVTGGAVNWNIEYGITGFTPGSGTSVINASKPLNIASLSAGTTYDVYVQDSCGTGDVSIWSTFSFVTSYGPHPFPLVEDFEDNTLFFENDVNSDVAWALNTTLAHAGSQSMHNAYGASDDNILHETGILDLSTTLSPVLEFWQIAKTEGTYDECYIQISIDGGATYTNLPSSAYTGAGSYSTYFHEDSYLEWGTGTETPDNTWWKKETFNLSAFNVANVSFRFVLESDGSGQRDGWYIDDIHIYQPACSNPINLTATGVTDTVAVLGWTTGGAANANLEFGSAGFTPGTGTMVTNAFNPTTIDTLTPNSAYEFYVQDSCGVGNVSAWVGPFTFNTQCGTFMAPYTESFDDTSIPDCWTMSGPEDWKFGGTWPDYGVSNVVDHTGNSGNWAGVDGSSGNNFGVSLESPFIDVTALITPAVEFYYYSNNTDNPGDNNELEVNVWDGAAWNLMRTIAEDNANWVKHTIVIANLTITGPVKIEFVVNQTAGTAYLNDQIIDDVSIVEAPTCPAPYEIMNIYSSMDTVVLNWNAGYQESMWNIEYGVAGFLPGSGTTMVASDTTDTIVGLDLGTVYEFYVQADCGGTDASGWVGPITVATPITNDFTCDAIAITPNNDFSSQLFTNIGATLQPNEASRLVGSRTHYNTVWFKTIVPASGHLFISTCGSGFTTRLGVYAADTIICDSLETFAEIDYNTYNYSICGNYTNSALEICEATPGDSIIFYVGGSTSTQSGFINLTVSDLGMEGFAGEGSATPVSACAGDTIDLWSNLSNQLTNIGNWEYPSNSAVIVDDTTANTGAFSLVGNEVYYIVSNSCDADTAIVIINATSTNTGMAVSNFQACSNGDVFLFDGLTGTIDAGGTWNDDTNTGLLNINKFVASGLPNGSYQFTYTVDNNICPADSTQVTVNLVDCTGLLEEESTTFGIYPNPNDGNFFISNGKNESNIVMEVVDVQGKVIFSNTYNMSAGSQQEVSLGNVESGVYLVRVITNNQVFNSNVIVK